MGREGREVEFLFLFSDTFFHFCYITHTSFFIAAGAIFGANLSSLLQMSTISNQHWSNCRLNNLLTIHLTIRLCVFLSVDRTAVTAVCYKLSFSRWTGLQ